MTHQEPVISLEAELNALAKIITEERSVDFIRAGMARGVWIYGAGGFGRKTRALIEAAGIQCLGFIDQRAGSLGLTTGTDVPVRTREEFSAASADAVVIGIHNYSDDLSAIVSWAKSVGFTNIYSPTDVADVVGPMADNYWLTSRSHSIKNIDAIVELAASMADADSAELVGQIAKYRISGDITTQPFPDRQNQYLPEFLPRLPEPVRFVDGGAFDGDTFRALQRASIAVSHWVAFEPDIQNFNKLSHLARQVSGSQVVLFPCGLGAGTYDLGFSEGDGAGSKISDSSNATSTIRIVALDEILVGVSPTFIKLDVEGAEADALQGMKGHIEIGRPRAAVSIYHKPADLWELPKLVKSLYGNVRMHIRQHGFNGFDTVLYADPD